MQQTKAHAKAVRLQSLRYGGTNQTTRKPVRSKWRKRRDQQLLESILTVIVLAVAVGIEWGMAI